MDKELLNQARLAAEAALRSAGSLVKEHYLAGATGIMTKDAAGDLVTETDYASESVLLEAIQSVFPYHRIRSEEAGDNGRESDWFWMVDPLDGTNNFAVGLPVVGISLTLCWRNEPVLGAIHEPLTDKMYVAVQGQGACCGGEAFIMPRPVQGRPLTLGWIQGHRVQKNEGARRLRHYLEDNAKRVMKLWAPTLQWSMLARGAIDGVVLFDSEGDDLYSGLLLVKEAGGVVMDFEGRSFYGMNPEPYLIACHPDLRETLLKLVRDGLSRKGAN
jgi:myo-inositol-1(or 4)-monophosphatase